MLLRQNTQRIFVAVNQGLKKAFEDLEFDAVKQAIKEYTFTASGSDFIDKLHLLSNKKRLVFELNCVQEYTSSFEQIPIPSMQAEEILKELHTLEIANSVLAEEQFMRIATLQRGAHHLVRFFSKEEHIELYPALKARFNRVVLNPEVLTSIEGVLDTHGIVKSSASPALQQIRSRQGNVRKQIERNFMQEMNRWRKAGYLDDIQETFINGKRSLAVSAEHKRMVGGQILGASGSGSITYIEPSSNIPLNNELVLLDQEERDEIYRILKELTNTVRHYLPELQENQRALVSLDVLRAKAKFAESINGILPSLHKQPSLRLINAYHPLLYLQNKRDGNKTHPQTISLTPAERLLVISGPNAGGKSITLKTVGLLQIMLQSGLLIPVEEGSEASFFDFILTDIGDNQSIENQLSTYSYRLKHMRYMLTLANAKTLLLIDEFGSGSDPELGGALAEVLFEELFSKKVFGVITTHYTNIKVKADELKGAFNGSMLFDEDTLEPTFKLSIGEPGSSFTFEVAEKNGIESRLIGKARTLVKGGKIKLDQSIARLQKEKARIAKLEEELKAAKQKTTKAKDDLEVRRIELEDKLERTHTTQELNNQWIILGKKFKKWQDQYQPRTHKKVMKEIIEFFKTQHAKKESAKEKKEAKKQFKLAPIEVKKQQLKKKVSKPTWKMPKQGDLVKMDGVDTTGNVVGFDKDKAIVTFGAMKMTIDPKKLFPKN